MANERICTNCGISDRQTYFISSSGGWCAVCMNGLYKEEQKKRAVELEKWQWLLWHDEPANKGRNRVGYRKEI